MSAEDTPLTPRCACGCHMRIEPHRPRARYRIGHRQRAHRRRAQELHERFWGRYREIKRRRPAVRESR